MPNLRRRPVPSAWLAGRRASARRHGRGSRHGCSTRYDRALFARHGADRPELAFDDRLLRALRGAAIGEVAVSVEEALAAVDREREEDARDAARHEFPHREHVGAHEERWQDFEHLIMLGLRDLEPLAGEEVPASPSAMAGSPRWRLNIRYISWRVATPSKTLRMVGEVCIGGSCWPGRTETRAIRLIFSSLQSFVTPPRRPPRRSGGSRAAECGRSFTLEMQAGHAAALHCHFIFPFSLFELLLLPLTSIRAALIRQPCRCATTRPGVALASPMKRWPSGPSDPRSSRRRAVATAATRALDFRRRWHERDPA